MSKRASNGMKAKKPKRARTDAKSTTDVWVNLLENDDLIACIIVNVETSETITISGILNSLQRQYFEVLQNSCNYNLYSGLNNEIRLPSSIEWIRKSHGGGWSDEALLVKFTRADEPDYLIRDEKLKKMHREMHELYKNLPNGAESELEKPKSLRISNVPQDDYKQLLENLNVKIKAATWRSLPNIAQEDGDRLFDWLPGAENSPANRKGYMKYLKTFSWPEGCDIVDVASEDDLLMVTLDDFSFTGTVDVALARTEVIREDIVEHHVLLGIELKKPSESVTEENYINQVIMQHLCASFQNPDTGVLTLVTDLNDLWCFFWFGGRRCIFKCSTNVTQAKYLLNNIFNAEGEIKCPEGFNSRLSWNECFQTTK